jgi:hypothetical protein
MSNLPLGRVPAELVDACADDTLPVLRTATRGTRFIKRVSDCEFVVIDHTGARISTFTFLR